MMTDKILYRKKFDMHVRNICAGLGGATIDTEKIVLHNSALLQKVDDIEKQLSESQSEVVRLKSLYEPEPVDTREEAASKAIKKVEDFLQSGTDFEFRSNRFYSKYVVNECLQEPDGGTTEYFEFPYAEPRDPHPGDLIEYNGSYFQLHHFAKEFYVSIKSGAYHKANCKQTGYRVTESGAIVPIQR